MTPWLARFEGGPAQGSPDRLFSVGEVWTELRLLWVGEPHGWALVGGDGIGDPPEGAWPESVLYTLVRVELGDVFPGERGPVAYYSPQPTSAPRAGEGGLP